MPQQCRICSHPKRQAIEDELLSGTTFRDVASRFAVSKDAAARHYHNHLTETDTGQDEQLEVPAYADYVANARAREDVGVEPSAPADSFNRDKVGQTRTKKEPEAGWLGRTLEQITAMPVAAEAAQVETVQLTAAGERMAIMLVVPGQRLNARQAVCASLCGRGEIPSAAVYEALSGQFPAQEITAALMAGQNNGTLAMRYGSASKGEQLDNHS